MHDERIGALHVIGAFARAPHRKRNRTRLKTRMR
jgi:hypothetical protein